MATNLTFEHRSGSDFGVIRVDALFDGVEWLDGPVELSWSGDRVVDLHHVEPGSSSRARPGVFEGGVAVPGLVDLHAGLSTWDQGLHRSWHTVSQSELALRSARNAHRVLERGVIAVLDPASAYNVSVAVRDCAPGLVDGRDHRSLPRLDH